MGRAVVRRGKKFLDLFDHKIRPLLGHKMAAAFHHAAFELFGHPSPDRQGIAHEAFPAPGADGHAELAGTRAEVIDIFFERRPVIVKARPQRTGLGVGAHVFGHVFSAEHAWVITRHPAQTVDVQRDVVTDQQLGQVGRAALKHDVPQAPDAPQVERFVLANQAGGGFQDEQTLDQFGMIVGQIIRHRATPVVADQADVLVAEVADERIHVRGQGAFVVARHRPFAVA